MNAIDLEMPQAIEETVQCADADPDVHIVALSGAGSEFCAGYDLKFLPKQKVQIAVFRICLGVRCLTVASSGRIPNLSCPFDVL